MNIYTVEEILESRKTVRKEDDIQDIILDYLKTR